MKRPYTVKRYNWNLSRTAFTIQTMGKDGLFYDALAASAVPQLSCAYAAKMFLAMNQYKHHKLEAWVEGPRGKRYQ